MPSRGSLALQAVVSVVTTLTAVAAATASIWSAKAARDAAARTSRAARAVLLRDLSQSVTAVISRGERINELVGRLRLARESHFALGGRSVAAAAPLIRADEQRRDQADLMVREARALEMDSFEKRTDDELHALVRNMCSYAVRVEITETDLSGQLERIEAQIAALRSRPA